jgi:hypothetical protein
MWEISTIFRAVQESIYFIPLKININFFIIQIFCGIHIDFYHISYNYHKWYWEEFNLLDLCKCHIIYPFV